MNQCQRLFFVLGVGISLISSMPFTVTAEAENSADFHLIRKISVPGNEGWDYISVDPKTNRLFVSRGTHVQVIDTKSGKLVGDIDGLSGVHGIAFDDRDNLGFISEGRANAVAFFDLKSLNRLHETPVGEGADCILFDPATSRVFTFNGRAKTATAVDAKTAKVVGTITLPGRPEFAVSDGKGYLYDNIEDKSEVVKIDAKSLAIVGEWPIAPAEGPSGIAVDSKNHLTFSTCDNQLLAVVDTESGKVIATPAIGRGPDACAIDPFKGLIFSPNGEDGTITVIHEDTPTTFSTIATITTQPGARTIAVDQKTHHLFTFTGDIDQSAKPDPQQPWRRHYVPGSFVVLEYGQ